jgi:hypothetical protein
MADQKLTQLPQATGAVPNDELYLVTDTATTPVSKRITFDDLQESFTDIEVDTINFNTAYTITGSEAAGTIMWNSEKEMLELVTAAGNIDMNEDLFFHCINQTGSNIAKGVAVMYAGAVGASGKIKIAPAVADGTFASIVVLGITYEAINNGDEGKVLIIGTVRGIDTTVYGTAGQILYIDPSSAGGLTTTEPSAPNLKYPIAATLDSKNNGNLVVRAIFTPNLSELNDVQIGTKADDDILSYNSTNSRWENKTFATLNGELVHNNLSGLTTGDPHTQYALLAGRSGGQTLYGGTASGNDLYLMSTSNATKGEVYIQNQGGQTLIGTGGFVDTENLRVYKSSGSGGAVNLLTRHDKTVAGGFNYGIKNEFNVNVTTGSTDSVQAFSNYVSNSNLGTITFVEAFTQGVDNLGTGTITNLSQIKIFTPTNNGTIGTLTGIYIENQAGATTNYSIYSDGGTMFHYGNILLGQGYLNVNELNNVPVIALGDGDILAGSSTSSFQYDSAGNLYFDRYTDTPTTTPQMFFRKARGTASSKTAITAGDDIGYIRGQSYDGTTFDEVTRIQFETSAAQNSGVISFHTSNAGATIGQRVTIREDGDVGIGTAAPAAKLHIDQASATAAVGCLTLDQADASEEYFDFITPALTAGNPVNTTVSGTYYGRARVRVNGTEKWIWLYNT